MSTSANNSWIFELSSETLDDSIDKEYQAGRGVPLLDACTTTYETFFQEHLIKNYPCIFSTELASGWESRKTWGKNVKISSAGGILENSAIQIDFDFLTDIYGLETVTATNCDKILDSPDSCLTIDMTFQEYSDYWKKYKDSNYSKSMRNLYLKDWHILRTQFHQTDNRNHKSPYEIPTYFSSDWLNEYCNQSNIDDFCFCYMGPRGSWTGFHSDVYGSFSWSANVIGRKKWWIYLPERVKALYESRPNDDNFSTTTTTSQVIYDPETPVVEGIDYYEVIQEAGQVIFIPSGWYHIVWNLEDTISINHNWFNGSNVEFIWRNLTLALNDVEAQLVDLRDDSEFPVLCQSLLKANHGMNYEDFLNILLYVWKSRTNQSTMNPSSSELGNVDVEEACSWKSSHFATAASFGPIHTQYDLKCIRNVISLIMIDIKEREKRGIELPKSLVETLAQFDIS